MTTLLWAAYQSTGASYWGILIVNYNWVGHWLRVSQKYIKNIRRKDNKDTREEHETLNIFKESVENTDL